MFGDEVTEVVLRFSPEVTRRVKESVWHPSQKLEDCDDGGCILRVWVAHPLEMKPFCVNNVPCAVFAQRVDKVFGWVLAHPSITHIWRGDWGGARRRIEGRQPATGYSQKTGVARQL